MDDRFREDRLSGYRAFSGKLLTLEVDIVRLSTGGEAVREVIRHPGAAVILPVLDDGRILFVRQYRYALAGLLLELPAGKLDAGEQPRRCAERELAEETGYWPEELIDLGSFFPAPGFSDEVIHAFLGRRLRPASGFAPDPDEQVEVLQFSLEEVRDLVRDGKIQDSKTLSALFLGFQSGRITTSGL